MTIAQRKHDLFRARPFARQRRAFFGGDVARSGVYFSAFGRRPRSALNPAHSAPAPWPRVCVALPERRLGQLCR